MKKFYLAFVAILLGVTASFAQPISDHAVIPIGVTLNPVLRIEVTNGGNIEFVFTSLAQYSSGLSGGANVYRTQFQVLSTRLYDVNLYTDPVANMIGQGTAATLPLSVINYTLTAVPAAAGVGDHPGTFVATATNLAPLTGFITDGGPDGTVAFVSTTNKYIIDWACGTIAAQRVTGRTPDRYAVNVLLEVIPALP